MSILTSAIARATRLAEENNCDYIIYQNSNGGDEEYSLGKKKNGMPRDTPELGRFFQILVEIEYGEDETIIHKIDEEESNRKKVEATKNSGGEVSKQLFVGREVAIVYGDGTVEKSTVADLSKRQVTTMNGMKFKRSNWESGWGSPEAKITVDPHMIEDATGEPVTEEALENIQEGDLVTLSTGGSAKVTKVSSRQIRAGRYKFAKSDGSGWGDQEVSIESI